VSFSSAGVVIVRFVSTSTWFGLTCGYDMADVMSLFDGIFGRRRWYTVGNLVFSLGDVVVVECGVVCLIVVCCLSCIKLLSSQMTANVWCSVFLSRCTLREPVLVWVR